MILQDKRIHTTGEVMAELVTTGLLNAYLEKVLHGDDEHKGWLRAKTTQFFKEHIDPIVAEYLRSGVR